MPRQDMKALRGVTYFASFFLAIHIAFAGYVNSSFLATVVPQELVGLVFSLSAGVSIACIQLLPRFLARNGILRASTLFGLAALFATIYLMSHADSLTLVLAFMAYMTLGILLKLNLDIYLEQLSEDEITGGIRGIFLTAINVAWLLSPLLAARLITGGSFDGVYLISALALVPLIYLTHRKLKEVPGQAVAEVDVLSSLKRTFSPKTAHDSDIHHILSIDFLLNFFYAVMVIYTPLYLRELGMDWSQMGIVFTFMLLPFVLLEIPLGKLADLYLGEKEILIAGLLVAAVFTASVAFIPDTSVVTWAIVLFMTRVGASAIEIMKETYLFKNISASDTHVLTLSRTNAPLAYLIAPAAASAALAFTSFQFLFLALGAYLFLGLRHAIALRDTK